MVEHVEVNDSVIGVLFHNVPDHVAAYEASAATKQYDAGSVGVGSATDG